MRLLWNNELDCVEGTYEATNVNDREVDRQLELLSVEPSLVDTVDSLVDFPYMDSILSSVAQFVLSKEQDSMILLKKVISVTKLVIVRLFVVFSGGRVHFQSEFLDLGSVLFECCVLVESSGDCRFVSLLSQ